MAFSDKRLMSFFMTDSCNMKCIYCTIHSHRFGDKTRDKSLVLNVDFAKCAIDDYFTNGWFFKPEERKGIRFFGSGEPTLEFERMKAIWAHAWKKSDGNLFVEMQSNGLFEDHVAHWIFEHVDLCWLSLDGVEDVQNRQRVTLDGGPSFNAVDRNVKILTKSPKTKVGLRPTTTAYSVDRQRELIDYGKENNVTAIYNDPWGYFLGKVKGPPDLMDFAEKFLEAWEYANSVGMPYGTEFTANFEEETKVYCRALYAAPSLTPDGCVTTCDMVNTKTGLLPRLFPELIIGKWKKDEGRIEYYPGHIEKVKSRNTDNLQACQGCVAMKHCAGGCMGSGMTWSGDFYGVNKEYCKITRFLFKKMPGLINRGRDQNVPEHP